MWQKIKFIWSYLTIKLPKSLQWCHMVISSQHQLNWYFNSFLGYKKISSTSLALCERIIVMKGIQWSQKASNVENIPYHDTLYGYYCNSSFYTDCICILFYRLQEYLPTLWRPDSFLSMDNVMDIHEGLAEWFNYMFCYEHGVLSKMFGHL